MFVNQTNLAKARIAWGNDMPEWVRTLAAACDRTSQSAVAAQIRRSSGYISRLIAGTYTGSYEEAEQLIRSQISADEVTCPIWGERIPLASCIANRRRKAPLRMNMHHLYALNCPSCPKNADADTSSANAAVNAAPNTAAKENTNDA